MEVLINLRKGEFFKLKESSNIVYVRGEYDKSIKRFCCCKFDDMNAFRYLPSNKQVFIDFEF